MNIYGLKLDGKLIDIKRAWVEPDPWKFPVASWESNGNYEVVELTEEDLNKTGVGGLL